MRGLNATEMTRMALCEAGYPDIADELKANRVGDPMIGDVMRAHPYAAKMIWRAADLAHKRLGSVGWQGNRPESEWPEAVR